MVEYIKREAVMQKFADHVERSNNSDFAPVPTWNQAVQIVEDFPAADVVERKKGKWIENSYLTRSAFGRAVWHKTYKCSECGSVFGREDDKYCYNCGADLREES